MDGVQQFGALRALSAADNQLADLEALRPLAGLQLEAASFEGNPVADLPNYRAHVLDLLGPSLQLLDGRPVSAEERGAAGGAVAHEATMLALMLSNACLVHKLGRWVDARRRATCQDPAYAAPAAMHASVQPSFMLKLPGLRAMQGCPAGAAALQAQVRGAGRAVRLGGWRRARCGGMRAGHQPLAAALGL